jgi:hypothetical protein
MTGRITINEGAAASTPSTGQVVIYAKTDGLPYAKDDAGIETALGFVAPLDETQGGTAQTTYATGDTLYASGADILAKRTIGSTGQVLTVVAGVPNWSTPATNTLGTPVGFSGQTSIDFTGIPSTATKIYINVFGLSLNGATELAFQLGDAGGVEITGYLGAGTQVSSGAISANSTTNFKTVTANGGAVYHGTIMLSLENSSNNTWICSGSLARSDAATIDIIVGSKSLTAALDRVRVTSGNGTATFDAGEVNISYA